MQCLSVPSRDRTYHYYRCAGTTNDNGDRCTMMENVRAESIEAEVYAAVRRLMDDKEYVLRTMGEHFARRRKDLSRADAATLTRRRDNLDRRRDGYYELAADGDIPKVRMREKVAKIEEELEQVERELERTRTVTRSYGGWTRPRGRCESG